MSRYEVVYFGEFFFGDKKTWNSYEARNWNDAYDFYSTLNRNGWRTYIKDNDEDVIFENGEWY